MTFSHADCWVWDFWIADDGDTYHLYYLRAPRALGDPDLRHRNASVGRATSTDLRSWTDHGVVLTAGSPGDDDATATWTGCVVRGDDGLWRMFYTGSRFLADDSNANIETVCVATSRDLHTWTKSGTVLSADPRWYERLSDGTWREEAWRDPWVYQDAAGQWHMLLTARASGGDPLDRGVIAHATSTDLVTWQAQSPVSEPGAGFLHLEVPQFAVIDGSGVVLFSCDSAHLTGARDGQQGGIWVVSVEDPAAGVDAREAVRLLDERYYSGRAVPTRDGGWVLLAFENIGAGGDFIGRLSDPMPLHGGPAGLAVDAEEATV